jgi:membrane-associated protein
MLDVLLHFDKYIDSWSIMYGYWAILLLAVVIFIESSCILFPFLPGDSLLFLTGVMLSRGYFSAIPVTFGLVILTIVGYQLNYILGKYAGDSMRLKYSSRFNLDAIEHTEHFFKKHGSVALIIARFLPIIRTFLPFVAGLANMNYGMYTFHNIIGGVLWINFFILSGYYLGSYPLVREHFMIFVFFIIAVSILYSIGVLIKYKKSQDNNSN